MNYDTQQQYAFSHGLAPQIHVQQQQHHLQQHQFPQQQQHIFQPQFNQSLPTSNVYQLQFAGGGSQIFQQKDAQHMGSVQQRINPHGMVSQPFIKQGMSLNGIEGIHVVNGLDGMIYSHPKNSLKIITNPDNRMLQQADGTLGMQQAIVGVDMMGGSNFIEQNLEVQQQNMAVASQTNMFTYNKQHFTGWLQPQSITTTNNEQCQTVGQSSLPSFTHLWSQFQHQKQVGVVHHHQHLNQYQQSQQFHQQPLQSHQFAGTNFQTLPGIQMIKMNQQPQKPQPISVPVSIQSVQHLPSHFHCFSPTHVNLMSTKCLDKDLELVNLNNEKSLNTQFFSASNNMAQSLTPSPEPKCTTAVTYTISGPPKVTVTLDSLTNCETFPPNGLLEKSTDMTFNSNIVSNNFTGKVKSMKMTDNLTPDNPILKQWQAVPHQRCQYIPKPLFHTSSTGSSFERSSSESSNFSSPPYTFTPPSSTDSLFSPVSTLFSKEFSSPKSVAITTSPPTTQYLSTSKAAGTVLLSESPHISTRMVTVSTPAISLASACTTTVTTTVASSYHSLALTTTSVTCTTPCSKESLRVVSAHSGTLPTNLANVVPESHSRPSTSAQNKTSSKAATDRKVIVPYSWQRKLTNGLIEYLSPSGVVLRSVEDVYAYLLSDTTCKCGLECPVYVEKCFCFDPEVGSKPWSPTSINGENLSSLCNHKREIIALSAFHSTQAEMSGKNLDSNLLGKKRLDRKCVSSGEDLVVSPLKRLKSSITKAVNKHAMCTSQLPFSCAEEPLINTNVEIKPSKNNTKSSPPVKVALGNPSNVSIFPSQPLSPVFTKSSVIGSKDLQPQCETKQTFHLKHHQTKIHFQQNPTISEVCNQVFHKELTNKLKDKIKVHNDPHSVEKKDLSVFYPNKMFLNNTSQLNSEGHQTFWQKGNSSTFCVSKFQDSPKSSYQTDYTHTDYIHSQATNFPKHSTPMVGHILLDPKKAKCKRPKSKKEKQKQLNTIVDRSSPCVKSTMVGNAVQPSSSVSFFDNPTVFVEQQTAIINQSIASCQISCSSPLSQNPVDTKHVLPVNTCVKMLDTSESVNIKRKLGGDGRKSVIDLDSNKSFSDTFDNGDSAYLSQLGSDQETNFGSDVGVESKNCDIYDFTISEENKHLTASLLDTLSTENEIDKIKQNKIAAATLKSMDKKTCKLKPKEKSCAVKKESVKEVELVKKTASWGSIGERTQPKCSNSRSISGLQQVLAQGSRADTVLLNASIPQVVSQATSVGLEFPASNLLSAAARAQLNMQSKEHVSVSLPNVAMTSAVHGNKCDILPTTCLNVSTGVSNPSISQIQQVSPCIQQIGSNANLIGNVMQLQQLTSGNFTMNMILPVCGQGQSFTTDSIHTASLPPDHDHKGVMTQGILATVSPSPDLGSQLKLSVTSVTPSNLGPQCSQDMLLNNYGPHMIMNSPMPPVSVSVVTNVTKSLAQVVPTIGINQTVFNTQPVTPQLINTHQSGPQIIGTPAPPPVSHVINTSPQGVQIVGSATPGAQLVNSTSQATQIMNALSVQSLNNQLLITNPIQQVSPNNSIPQLSPAIAAQILAQGQQQLQQMSPSFLQTQIQKQNANNVLSGQNIFASVSLPTLTVTPDQNDSLAHSGIISNFQSNTRSEDQLDKTDIGNIKDTVSIANSSLYVPTSQPVFVIPQPNANPVVQVLGTSQQLNSASSLSTDVNNITQIFSQSPSIDHNQLQNLINTGFNPINFQQMMGAVNLTGVHQQQQQQLQMLQLHQLLLQQIQSGNQNIQGISLPMNQNSSTNQGTLGAQTIVNTVVPQRGLHLNSVMDINALHSSLSPVAQGYQNQLAPASAQLQHISPSALTVHQVTSVNTSGPVGVIHNTGVPGLVQTPTKSLPSVVATVQSQQIASDQVIPINKTPTLAPSGMIAQESIPTLPSQTAASSISKAVSVSVAGNKMAQSSKASKSKSAKSKKSESKKMDPESERNEEDIAATVHQILAEAVQQQKELILAAKNQPPPPPKSKSKKSQMRARSTLASKEHELGKLASISDETSFVKSEGIVLQDKQRFDISLQSSDSVNLTNSFTAPMTMSSQFEIDPPGVFSNHVKKLTSSAHLKPSTPIQHAPSCQPTFLTCLNTTTSFVEQAANNTVTSSLNCSGIKKSGLSLKDHLSSIISRDKDGTQRKASAGCGQKQGKSKSLIDHPEMTLQSVSAVNGDATCPQKTIRKSVK